MGTRRPTGGTAAGAATWVQWPDARRGGSEHGADHAGRHRRRVALTLFVLERFRPLRRLERPLGPRLLVNGAMSVLTYSTAFAVVQMVAIGMLAWTSRHSFGVLALVGGPWSTWVLGFLLLDLSFYYWHRLNHRVPFLWRFHNVHHVDPDLDVSTGRLRTRKAVRDGSLGRSL